MKTYRLVKGNETIHVHIGKHEAVFKTSVNGNEGTSQLVMTPLEGNRRVNELLRKGYANKK